MDTRQIENIIRIAEERNITRAAEKLFLSQPALNQQLLNLEKELGTQLFVRERGNWSLTEAGKIYVETGKKILELKKEAYARISDLAQVTKETLTVGVTPGSGDEMMAYVFKKIYARYPQIRLKIIKKNSQLLQKEIEAGNIDVGIMTVSHRGRQDTIQYRNLLQEEMVVVMSEKNPLSACVRSENGRKVQRLLDLQDMEFAIGSRSGSVGTELIMRNFAEAGITPKICYEGGGFPMRMAMVEMDLCLSIIEEHHKGKLPAGVSWFYMEPAPVFYVVAASRRGRYLSAAARDFISIAEEYWNNLLK